MIQDRVITHCCSAPSFWNWEPTSELQKEILLTVIATLLAYQLYGLGIDLLFGFKPRGSARVSDLGALLLAEESSISATLAALLPSTAFPRWIYHGLRSTFSVPRQNSEISRSSSFKLVVTLALGLIAFYFSNFLVIEQDRIVSMKEAGFGGIAGGINDDLSTTESVNFSPSCFLYTPNYSQNEFPIMDCCNMEIFKCEATLVAPTRTDTKADQNSVILSIGKDASQTIFFNVTGYEFIVEYSVYMKVETDDKVYRLKQSLSEEQGIRLLEVAAQTLSDQCETESRSSMVDEVPEVSVQGADWDVSRKVACGNFSTLIGAAVIISVVEKITVINSNSFEVAEVTGMELEAEDNFLFASPLLRRSGGFLGLGTLLVVFMAVTVARILVGFVTNNDIDIGLETIFKNGVGAQSYDSALQRVEKRNYDEFSYT